jgi:hypothetical protein
MPKCPNCNHEIDRLYSNSRIDLVWCQNKWMLDIMNQKDFVCPNCYKEMGINDLDKLRVPLKLR